jgi:ERCC4-related helicase
MVPHSNWLDVQVVQHCARVTKLLETCIQREQHFMASYILLRITNHSMKKTTKVLADQCHQPQSGQQEDRLGRWRALRCRATVFRLEGSVTCLSGIG